MSLLSQNSIISECVCCETSWVGGFVALNKPDRLG